MERSVILTKWTDLQVPISELQAESRLSVALAVTLKEAEREQIVRVLREAKWSSVARQALRSD